MSHPITAGLDGSGTSARLADTQPRRTRRLAEKLCEIMLEVEGLHKDAQNDFMKYRFASAENVFGALRKPLAERGILLLPAITAIRERDFKTPKGKDSTLTTIDMLMTFRDAQTGEEIICTWAGSGDDPADKGLYKAMTGGVRTFLRDTFLLPQGDDPELDRRTDERAARRQAARAPVRARELDGEGRARMVARFEELGIVSFNDQQKFFSAAGIEDLQHILLSNAKTLSRLLDDHEVKMRELEAQAELAGESRT